MSERLLRDIERRNKPVSATYITAIATALGTTSDEITLSLPDETLNASASLLKLKPSESARELYTLASGAFFYRWELKVIPSAATAEDMRQVMTILRRLVFGRRGLDEFDALPFGEIPGSPGYRIAREAPRQWRGLTGRQLRLLRPSSEAPTNGCGRGLRSSYACISSRARSMKK